MVDKHPNSKRMVNIMHLTKECERLSKRRKHAIVGNFKPDDKVDESQSTVIAKIDDKKQMQEAQNPFNTSIGAGYFDREEQDLPLWIAKLFRDETPVVRGAGNQNLLPDPFAVADDE